MTLPMMPPANASTPPAAKASSLSSAKPAPIVTKCWKRFPRQKMPRPVASQNPTANSIWPSPDDPAADEFMQRADGHRGWKHWLRNGDSPSVEFPEWRHYLELEPDGFLKLTPERAVHLALLHSREYQTQQEDLFLTALALT